MASATYPCYPSSHQSSSYSGGCFYSPAPWGNNYSGYPPMNPAALWEHMANYTRGILPQYSDEAIAAMRAAMASYTGAPLPQYSVKIPDYAASITGAQEAAQACNQRGRMVFYTDASFHDWSGTAGAAVAYINGNEAGKWAHRGLHLPPGTFRGKIEGAEVLAMAMALEIAVEHFGSIDRWTLAVVPAVEIFSDCQFALRRMDAGGEHIQETPSTPDFQAVTAQIAKLNDMGVQVQFTWVKGHAAVDGNQKADFAAKYALEGYEQAAFLK